MERVEPSNRPAYSMLAQSGRRSCMLNKCACWWWHVLDACCAASIKHVALSTELMCRFCASLLCSHSTSQQITAMALASPHWLHIRQQLAPTAASDRDNRVSCKVSQSAEFSLVLTLSFVWRSLVGDRLKRALSCRYTNTNCLHITSFFY